MEESDVRFGRLATGALCVAFVFMAVSRLVAGMSGSIYSGLVAALAIAATISLLSIRPQITWKSRWQPMVMVVVGVLIVLFESYEIWRSFAA